MVAEASDAVAPRGSVLLDQLEESDKAGPLHQLSHLPPCLTSSGVVEVAPEQHQEVLQACQAVESDLYVR